MNAPHHYTACGLDFVYLANGFDVLDTPYGRGLRIHDVDGLHRAIAMAIIGHGGRLTGQEMRFLRKEMEMTQAELAIYMDTSPQTVARWEKASHKAVVGPGNLLMRIMYLGSVGDTKRIGDAVKMFANLDDMGRPPVYFETTPEGWRSAVNA